MPTYCGCRPDEDCPDRPLSCPSCSRLVHPDGECDCGWVPHHCVGCGVNPPFEDLDEDGWCSDCIQSAHEGELADATTDGYRT